MAAYIDEEVDQVEIFYNGYISPVTQEVRRETLLPLQQATVLEEESEDEGEDEDRGERASEHRALVEYEPDPEEILERLVPGLRGDLDLPGAAGVDGVRARCPYDRDAQRLGQRRGVHRGLTLEMNRARQAEITQEILEVVAGAEALSR